MSGRESDESGNAARANPPICSFCKKALGEGVLLIEGPILEGSIRAHICSDCVELCTSLIGMQRSRVAAGLPEDLGVHAAATQQMLREKVDEVLASLREDEREVIELRYGLKDGQSYTLEEVARIFQVTRERVREIEVEAVAKLQGQELQTGPLHQAGGSET